MSPRKATFFELPEWTEDLTTEPLCLSEAVTEALVARASAIQMGAGKTKARRAVINAGDTKIENIRYGRYGGDGRRTGTKMATDALRKYLQARALVSLGNAALGSITVIRPKKRR